MCEEQRCRGFSFSSPQVVCKFMWSKASRVSSNRQLKALHNFNFLLPPSCDVDVITLVKKYVVGLVSFRLLIYQKIHQHNKRVFVVKWDRMFSSQMRHGLSALGYQVNPFSRSSIFVAGGTKRRVKSFTMMGGINNKTSKQIQKGLISLATFYAKWIIMQFAIAKMCEYNIQLVILRTVLIRSPPPSC